uniref:MazG domain-containing protein n=1 Tax=Parastrongyloides trichosuri TaxID=131310 RepID=A0A0N4ZSI1_PARTI
MTLKTYQDLNCKYEDIRKLVVMVEQFGDELEIQDVIQFKNMVDCVVEDILGAAHPEYLVESFENNMGTICCDEKDANKIWACLSLAGYRMGQRISVHFNKILKPELKKKTDDEMEC